MAGQPGFTFVTGTCASSLLSMSIVAFINSQIFYDKKAQAFTFLKMLVWEKPVQQAAYVEILTSNERPAIIAVFGTPNLPGGLSGKIRRYAFKFSESSYGGQGHNIDGRTQRY